MRIIKGDLVLTEDTIINDDIKVEGNVRCEGGLWNLNCWNLNCWNLTCRDLTCKDLSFWGVAISYYSFKCKSWNAKRDNYVIKCLDGEIEIKDEKKFCDKCGQEIKEKKE